MGDEDDDDENVKKIGPNKNDSDADFDNDSLKPRGYNDSDDHDILSYGHAATSAERRSLTAVAERYYTAAAGQDGATACSMLTRAFAGSVVEDYGRGSAGPFYLSSGGSCSEVMTLLFKHLHAQLSVPIKVTGIRVDGDHGLIFMGSKVLPAGCLITQREAGGWRVVGLLAVGLP